MFMTARSPRSKIARVLAGLLVAGLAVTGGLALRHQLTSLPDDAAFRYDGHVVTKARLEDRVETLKALYGISEPTARSDRAEFRRDTAKAVVVSMILDDEATRHDIVVSEKSSRDTLSRMLADQLGTDSRAAFSQLLARYGVSEDDVLAEVRRQQSIARLFQVITKKAVDSVTAEDVRARYASGAADFAQPESRKLANIVVASKADAEAVLRQLRAGKPFKAVAKARSLDDSTRAKGGVLGVATASQLDPTYAEAAFAAREGAFFGPVQSTHGWNVGQVLEVVPSETPAFEDVEADVRDALRSERALKSWRSWLTKQITAADVEYADAYRPDHPDAPPALDGLQGGLK